MSRGKVNGLQVFIPSRSRWNKCITLEQLKGKWDDVNLVVPKDQVSEYRPLAKRHGVTLLGCPENGIAHTRRWIGERANDKFLMLDDDLRFFFRPYCDEKGNPGNKILYMLGKWDMVHMLTAVDRYLEIYKHVSISAREGNIHHDLPHIECSRPLRALAYRRKEFLACEHGRFDIMEDFDVTLQLLSEGYRNAVITMYAQNQVMTQMPGGCSDYRTHELHERNVRKFVDTWSPYAVLTVKDGYTGNDFKQRVEARIYWQKLYQHRIEEVLGHKMRKTRQMKGADE